MARQRARAERDEVVSRAKAYPFLECTTSSYLFRDGRSLQTDAAALRSLASEGGRVPVLASGSNASSEQLRRKLGSSTDDPIPVARVHLADFSVVYSAHFTRYGAMPATLLHTPGTVTTTFLTYLTPKQLELMYATESENYDFVRISEVSLTSEIDLPTSYFFAYSSIHGCFAPHGSALALQAAPVENPLLPVMGEEAVLLAARDILDAGTLLDDFIRENVSDTGVRRSRTRHLRNEFSVPFRYPHLEVVDSSPGRDLYGVVV